MDRNNLRYAKQVRSGKVANELGIGVQTLHFYERQGLVPAAPRSDSGYRLYSRELIDRVAFIRKAQMLGLSLHEIKEVLALVDHGACPCGRVRNGLEKKLAEIDQRLAELKDFRRGLSSLIKRSDELGERSGNEVICSIVEKAPIRTSKLATGTKFGVAPIRLSGMRDSGNDR